MTFPFVNMAPSVRKPKSAKSDSKIHRNDKSSPSKSNSRRQKNYQTDPKAVLLTFSIAFAAILVGLSHRNYIYTLFENDKHFSHLSTLERELAFRTEMGLYFSYFKTVITAPSFADGLQQIMWDNVTEHPSTINTLKRFNLYPEVILGGAYRIYDGFSKMIDRPTKQCWRVNRGEGLSPVESCEGLGEPSYFYVEFIFILQGLMMTAFFLFGTYLSESIFGGLLVVICYYFNHGECTRVMWTPPLRESFGYPLFVVQMFLVTRTLRNKESSLMSILLLAAVQVSFMLSWQFAQFALLTQTLAVLATYFLQYTSSGTLKAILMGQTIGLLTSYVLLFGNEMLLTSLFACCLNAAWVIVCFEKLFEALKIRILIWAAQGVTLIAVTAGTKFAVFQLLQLEDDAHIGEIFRSKFTDFQNFHTMLYTCAKEFDFIEYETLRILFMTLLIPASTIALIASAVYLLKLEWTRMKGREESPQSKKSHNQHDKKTAGYSEDSSKTGGKDNAEIVYHIFQLLAFTAMAILIMRLKLFWTPHMCLFTSLLASRKIFGNTKFEIHLAILVGLVGVMAWQGTANIQKQRSIMGEFSNIEQEELVEWIKAKTPTNAVFAGAMPTMATVKLCTLRPIVNHPHYEDAGLRNRTMIVYGMYSRKPVQEVKKNLEGLGVQYYILEDSWCRRRTKVGCSMPEIWDVEDVENQGKTPLCSLIIDKPEPYFERVFQNRIYDVLKLKSKKSKRG